MKVLDIISETTVPDPRTLTPEQITAFLDDWNRRNPHSGSITYSVGAHENFFQRFIRERSTLVAAEEARVASMLGWIRPLFAAIGIVGPIVMWRVRMSAINEMAGEKNENGQYKYSDKEIFQERDLATGMLVTVFILDAMRKSIQSGIIFTALRDLLRTAVVGAGGRFGVRGAAVAFIASEAFVQGAKIWLNTDAGREWFTQNWIIKGAVGLIGHGADWLIKQTLDLIGLKDKIDLTPNITQREKDQVEWEPPGSNLSPEELLAKRRASEKKALATSGQYINAYKGLNN